MNEYKLIKMKNGMRLMLVPKQSTEIVTILVMFGVGSRQESDKQAGISHVLEHMHYKGTEKRPSGLKIAEFIESIGGEHNAFTGKEYTGYYAKVTPKHMEHAFDFLSDILLNSKFDEADLEKEKDVILQEINMYEDLPMEIVHANFEKVMFGDNALGRDVIGNKKTVKSISREDLIEYRNHFYQSDNVVIGLAGNFGTYSEADLVDLVESTFKFGTGKKPNSESVLIDNSRESITIKKTEQSHVVVGFRTVSYDHPDYFKLELLGMILGGSMSSRMFEEVREKRGLAYSVRTSSINFQESGALATAAGIEHEKVLQTVEAILDEYRKIKVEKISEAELSKAKEIILGRMLIRYEDSEELAYHYVIEPLLCKQIYKPKEIGEIYQNITADDILEVANKYLVDETLGLAFIGPKLDKLELKKIFKI